MSQGPSQAGAHPDRSSAYLETLLQLGRAPVGDCPPEILADASALGLVRVDDVLTLPPGWDPLAVDAIRAGLSGAARRWLTALEVRAAIGSTNVELADRAKRESIAGQVCLAEIQLAGRGRRGRSWLSPLGGNLAISLGFEAQRPAAELGGLSLVVGLAVVDALEASGITGLALKWPNDILLDGAKLGGILIEYVGSGPSAALVIGVGVNVRIPAAARSQVDQPVTDLASAVQQLPPRSQLAARLISSIVEFEAEYMVRGFAPFAAVFDARHICHGAEIVVIQGEQVVPARVLGVAEDGGLRIMTDAGATVIHAGEVSLRMRR